MAPSKPRSPRPSIRIGLDALLARRGLTLDELAQAAGVSRQTLWTLKTGRAGGIRFALLQRLCEALQCSPGEFLVLEHAASEGHPGADFQPSAEEWRVLETLKCQPAQAEDLREVTGLSPSRLHSILTELEIRGAVMRSPGAWFSIRG